MTLNQNKEQAQNIDKMFQWIKEADAIVIGAGAGLSASAGLLYSGPRFENNFQYFINKYGMTDMYSAGFYPFKSQEAKWGYWSHHIWLNRYAEGPLPLYKQLLKILEDKRYFVITTNVDHQFLLSGFDPDRLFAPQGDYGLYQCEVACHDTLYDNKASIQKMLDQQEEGLIPSDLVPKCPVCGGNLMTHLRIDDHFVENSDWHKAANAYTAFIEKHQDQKICFLELGVGMNTPVIIKYPFWRMTKHFPQAHFISINRDDPYVPREIEAKSLVIDADINEILFQWEV